MCISVIARHNAFPACVRPWLKRYVTRWSICSCSSDIATLNDVSCNELIYYTIVLFFSSSQINYIVSSGKQSFVISRKFSCHLGKMEEMKCMNVWKVMWDVAWIVVAGRQQHSILTLVHVTINSVNNTSRLPWQWLAEQANANMGCSKTLFLVNFVFKFIILCRAFSDFDAFPCACSTPIENEFEPKMKIR